MSRENEAPWTLALYVLVRTIMLSIGNALCEVSIIDSHHLKRLFSSFHPSLDVSAQARTRSSTTIVANDQCVLYQAEF